MHRSTFIVLLMNNLSEVNHTTRKTHDRVNDLCLSGIVLPLMGSKCDLYLVYSWDLRNVCLFLCKDICTELYMADGRFLCKDIFTQRVVEPQQGFLFVAM